MFNSLISLFTSEVTIINDTTRRKENTIKQLISRHSNGNTNLQQSKYITDTILKQKQKNNLFT